MRGASSPRPRSRSFRATSAWPAKALAAARATLESARRPGQRRVRAVSGGPAPPPDRAHRRGGTRARRSRSRASPTRVEDGPRAGGGGDRDSTARDESGARRLRGPNSRRTRAHPRADGGGRERPPRPPRARGAPRRGWRGASPPARGGRGVTGVEGLGRGRVPSCRPPCRQGGPTRQAPRAVRARTRAGGKRGLATCRGTRWSREPSGSRSPTIHIERGCASRSGGCAPCSRRWPGCARRSEGSRWRRGAGARWSCWPRRSRGNMVGCSPFSPTGNRGRARPLALALTTSQRTVQQALDSLAAAGEVRSFGQGRARRWIAPPRPGFTTTLLLPPPLPTG